MEAEKGRRRGTFLVEGIYDARPSGFIRGDLSRDSGDFADYAREVAASGAWAGIH